MQIFIDSADIQEIRKAAAYGLVDGVTTNPTLVAKTGRKMREVLTDICATISGPVSAEVLSTDYETMLSEARHLAAIAPNIVIKIPLIPAGLRAIKTLNAQGVRTNCTLCFSTLQAWLAAKAGATYISPFVGRLDDIGENGMDLIAQIVRAYRNYGFTTKVLVASVRTPAHVLRSLEIGADVATIPANMIDLMCQHPLTDRGLERFLADAAKIPREA